MPCHKFYKAAHDEEKFQRKLASAIKLIEKNESDIAKKVLQALHSKQVTLLSFYRLAKKDHFFEIRRNYFVEGNLKCIPRTFPPENWVISIIESNLCGMRFDDNHIYLSSNMTIDNLAETIIHEVAHHLNDALLVEDLSTKSEANARYLDEIRSFTAERYFEKNGLRLLRSDVKSVHLEVSEHYPEYVEGDGESQRKQGFHPGCA